MTKHWRAELGCGFAIPVVTCTVRDDNGSFVVSASSLIRSASLEHAVTRLPRAVELIEEKIGIM